MRVPATLPSAPRLGAQRRLAVAWQDPVTRALEPVGVVVADGDSRQFRDLRRARHFGRLPPLLGFGDTERTDHCAARFGRFAQRGVQPGRPDHSACLRRLSSGAPSSHGMFLPAHTARGGPDLPAHLRRPVELQGCMSPQCGPFAGAEWATELEDAPGAAAVIGA